MKGSRPSSRASPACGLAIVAALMMGTAGTLPEARAANRLPALITLTNTWLNGTNGVLLAGANDFDTSGLSVSSAGDVNGDGLADLLVGAYGAHPSGRTAAGETYLADQRAARPGHAHQHVVERNQRRASGRRDPGG